MLIKVMLGCVIFIIATPVLVLASFHELVWIGLPFSIYMGFLAAKVERCKSSSS